MTTRRNSGWRGGGVAAAAGVAVLSAVTLGLTPSVSAGVQLLADETPDAYFVRGTRIGANGYVDEHYVEWADRVLTSTVGTHNGPTNVPYSGGFWPVSSGYLTDPTFGAAVDEGVDQLTRTIAAGGDTDNDVVIFGYSEGAVVATEYLRAHPNSGNTYVLIGNPNRPNGGILQRFNGFYIPVLDLPFNGATPTDGDPVIDIAYRYDGWADFPKYPLNLVASANALMGILMLHGKADKNITAETLADAEVSTHGNTTYYLLNSKHVPLLMPFEGIVPDSILGTLDAPLRAVIETGYDRGDYGKPEPAELIPGLRTTDVPDADADADADEIEADTRPDFRDKKHVAESTVTTQDDDEADRAPTQSEDQPQENTSADADPETPETPSTSEAADEPDQPAETSSEAA